MYNLCAALLLLYYIINNDNNACSLVSYDLVSRLRALVCAIYIGLVNITAVWLHIEIVKHLLLTSKVKIRFIWVRGGAGKPIFWLVFTERREWLLFEATRCLCAPADGVSVARDFITETSRFESSF